MRTLLGASLAILLGGSAALAQTPATPNSSYRYVDEHGVVHWTQSLHFVPPPYTSRATTPDFNDTTVFPPAPPYVRPMGSSALAITLDHEPRLPSLHGKYADDLRRLIAAAWKGRGKEGQQPVVSFYISRDGRLTIPDVERSSGDFAYDLKARDTIIALRHMPPLPKDFRGQRVLVHVGFAFLK